MLLSEIFNQLNYGELADTELAGGIDSNIAIQNYPAIISHINIGLSELYKRFELDTSQIVIQLYNNISLYNLQYDYAVSNTTSTKPIKYLMDTPSNPFNDRVIKILDVYDGYGLHFPLNDPNKTTSLFTPSYNKLQVPYRRGGEFIIYVEYLSDHIPIPITTLNLDTVNVNIPDTLLQTLLYFVASRVFTNMTGGKTNEGNNYLAKFEASCNKYKELNAFTRDNYSNNIGRDGWV